jgi:F-type H+-transporting ATPase subunit delta
MSNETIARRYSAALADVVMSSGEAETVKHELADFAKILKDNSELESVFSSPAIAHVNKEKVLEQLVAKTRPSKTTANFLRVLLRNGRLTELSSVNDRFGSVLEERSGVVSAQITSAREMPDSERAGFEKELERLTGKRVSISYAVDNDIIGGVVTRIGSTVYDNSVKTKLENLKEQLVSG